MPSHIYARRFSFAIFCALALAVSACGGAPLGEDQGPTVTGYTLPECDESGCPDDGSGGSTDPSPVNVVTSNKCSTSQQMTVQLFVSSTSDISGVTPLTVLCGESVAMAPTGDRIFEAATYVPTGRFLTMRVKNDTNGATTDMGMVVPGGSRVVCTASISDTAWGPMPAADCRFY